MICVLRVKTQKSALPDLGKFGAMKPYRIDENVSGEPEAAYLHYSVMDEEVSFSEGVQILLSFLDANAGDIELLSKPGCNELEFDVGMSIFEAEFSKSLSLCPKLMGLLARRGIALTLSLYQTSESDVE